MKEDKGRFARERKGQSEDYEELHGMLILDLGCLNVSYA
jgi:hypothetical protein